MKFKIPLLIILISFIPLLDLFYPGLPITHDGQDHVARVANFYQNLSDGAIVPRWAPNLNWGYGHPILMFLYPFPSYLASAFHFLGFNFVDSLKILFGLSFVLSALAMYLWLKQFLPQGAAYFGSLLYIFAPYRFVDLYVRGAIGEHVAFVFPPLILYTIYKLSKTKNSQYIIIGALSWAGLILSHNALSIMFLPFFLFYGIIQIMKSKTRIKLSLNLSISLTFGFALSAFFWVPAFFEGKYTLREIVTSGGYIKNFSNFTNLLYSHWNYGLSGEFSLQIGILQLILIPISIYYLIKLKHKKEFFNILVLALIFFIISAFLVTDKSQIIWHTITLFQKFQFPWRFLSLTIFSAAIIGGIAVANFPKKNQFYILLALTLILLFLNKDYWHAKGFILKEENFYTSVYKSTTDTGESAPIWSVRFMEKEPTKNAELIGGLAEIDNIYRNSTNHSYKIIVHKKAQIRENTLYFPGWKVYANNKSLPIEYQDPNSRGLITFFLDPGEHLVKIVFEETRLRLISDYISLAALIIIFVLCILRIKKLWPNFQ